MDNTDDNKSMNLEDLLQFNSIRNRYNVKEKPKYIIKCNHLSDNVNPTFATCFWGNKLPIETIENTIGNPSL